MNCRKITATFWCIVWDAQWVFKWTYMCVILRIRKLSSWWCKCADANPFSAWNNVSKSFLNFTAVQLQQKEFYSMGPRMTKFNFQTFAISRVWTQNWTNMELSSHRLQFTSHLCPNREGPSWPELVWIRRDFPDSRVANLLISTVGCRRRRGWRSSRSNFKTGLDLPKILSWPHRSVTGSRAGIQFSEAKLWPVASVTRCWNEK